MSMREFPEIIGFWDIKIKRETSAGNGQQCPINLDPRWSKGSKKEGAQMEASMILEWVHRLLQPSSKDSRLQLLHFSNMNSDQLFSR